jgi:hypothetical protein
MQNPLPESLAALKESEQLNTGIFRCVYQSVNCSAETVTNIVLPIMPLIASMSDRSVDKYFDCPSNIDVLKRLSGEILAGKDVPHHYLHRLKLVVPFFSEKEQEAVRDSTLAILIDVYETISTGNEIIREGVLNFVIQLLEVLSVVKLQEIHFETIFDRVGMMMRFFDERCPFLANNKDVVSMEVLDS